MGVVVRAFQDADFEAVVQLECGEKRNRYGACVFVRQSAELYPETFLVADVDRTAVGYTIGAQVQGDAATVWVLRLGVARHWRGQGIGTVLVSHLISELATREVRRIFLSGAPDNISAKKIYDRLGFVKVARQSGYFCDGEDRDIMQLLDLNREKNASDNYRTYAVQPFR